MRVIYPPTIMTDKEKLFAVYSLVQQMIDEYNRQSYIASADKATYEGKFRQYTKEQFDPRLKQLLAERNRLIEKIRWDNYTKEEWKAVSKLSVEEYQAIHVSLFGDRSIEEAKPTLATSPVLDELKAISLDNLQGALGADPTEDFTTYTEVDEGLDITKTADRITFTNAYTRLYTEYVYYDKGSNHFDGDFEHRHKFIVSSSTGTAAVIVCWAITNAVGDYRDWQEASASAFLLWYYSTTPDIRLTERDGASEYTDSGSFGVGTLYYITNERDEGVGSYGTLTSYICTGNYYGESGSSLVHTLSVTLHTSKKDFQNIYGFAGHDEDNPQQKYVTGYVELLDLQEGGAHYERSGTALLGLLGSGSRGFALARTDTALLGLLPTATRAASYLRTKTALLGLKATASRSIAISRVKTALLGLKIVGSRAIAITRSKIALLGLLGTGSRALHLSRSKTALLGLLTTANKSISLARVDTAMLGLKTTANRTISITRAKVALLGLKATGIMSTVKHYIRTGIAYLGLTVTGSRAISLSRSALAYLGLKVTGIYYTAEHYYRTGIAYLGLVAMGTRSLALARTKTALLGLKTTGSRTISITRSGLALLGLKAIGSFETILLKILAARPYTIEVRNGDGDLIAILENAHSIDYRQEINAPHSLRFQVPTTDSKVDNVLLANEYWLRDNRTGIVIRKFKLQHKRDTR